MCLIVECAPDMEPHKIAKEPIKVYKLMITNKDKTKEVPQEYRSLCAYGAANVGDTVRALSNEYPRSHCDSSYKKTYVIGPEGVHGYLTEEAARARIYMADVITEWEIPAGAKYWEGTGGWEGEIAATEMKFIRVIAYRRKKHRR